MKKMALILMSIIITSCAANPELKDKIVLGKKCTLNEEGLKVSSYIWIVQKDMDWKKEINKKNCKE